jgi:hypothetical protein
LVKATDVEGLLQKYLEEGDLERADALYLLLTSGREEAAKILRVRYGRSGAINSVLEDLNTLGVKAEGFPLLRTEDTQEDLKDVVTEFFNRVCINKVIEAVKAKANTLSRPAKEILYLISLMWPDSINKDNLRRSYRLLFGRDLTEKDLARALEELIGCYVIQYVGYNELALPPYLDTLLRELQSVLPRVEVKVSWPEGEK